MEVAKAFRAQCQTQTGASNELVDGINLGEFPRDPSLMVRFILTIF